MCDHKIVVEDIVCFGIFQSADLCKYQQFGSTENVIYLEKQINKTVLNKRKLAH